MNKNPFSVKIDCTVCGTEGVKIPGTDWDNTYMLHENGSSSCHAACPPCKVKLLKHNEIVTKRKEQREMAENEPKLSAVPSNAERLLSELLETTRQNGTMMSQIMQLLIHQAQQSAPQQFNPYQVLMAPPPPPPKPVPTDAEVEAFTRQAIAQFKANYNG